MSYTETELVIRISAPESCQPTLDNGLASAQHRNSLIVEMKECLHPGALIALTYRDYVAITAVLWVSEPQEDNSFRAGVRLLGLSPAAKRNSSAKQDDPDLQSSVGELQSPAF